MCLNADWGIRMWKWYWERTGLFPESGAGVGDRGKWLADLCDTAFLLPKSPRSILELHPYQLIQG